jgi:hypothetical protein
LKGVTNQSCIAVLSFGRKFSGIDHQNGFIIPGRAKCVPSIKINVAISAGCILIQIRRCIEN